jgi:hypothetical protein
VAMHGPRVGAITRWLSDKATKFSLSPSIGLESQHIRSCALLMPACLDISRSSKA